MIHSDCGKELTKVRVIREFNEGRIFDIAGGNITEQTDKREESCTDVQVICLECGDTVYAEGDITREFLDRLENA